MKRFVRFGIAFTCAVLFLGLRADSLSSRPGTAAPLPAKAVMAKAAGYVNFQVEPVVAIPNLKRLGVNLGNWTAWGAEQLSSNVLKNPGFEGLIDRALVIVRRADQQRFADDTSWLGREDGFWAGAQFDVRTGKSAGQQGIIGDSRRAASDGLPEYITAGNAPTLNSGDVVALTRVTDTELPTQWWISAESKKSVSVVNDDSRPGSPGIRSLALKPSPGRPAEIISYLDAIGDRAGKLLPVKGAWRFSFWSRCSEGSTPLTIEFRRQGSPVFLSKTITPGSAWKNTAFEFSPDDSGPAGTLELRLLASGDSGTVLLDDFDLGAIQPRPFPFRAEVVNALEKLHPGYLRDWQGQLGDTLANRLAEPFARRTSRYRPSDDIDFGYSLTDFLTLCARVQAIPWIVIPTTFSDEELTGLGRFLEWHAGPDRFEEVLVEFGNENWNQLFRPAGIPDPRAHGEAAERAFSKLRESVGTRVRLLTVVNGQHVNPEYSLRFAKPVPSADILALAPYVQHSLSAGLSQADRFAGLFAGDDSKLSESADGVRALGKELAIYEVNLHTLEGNAKSEDRDPLTAGAIGGSALAKVMLDALALGVQRQCLYTLAGYDTWLADRSGYAKLFGIVRDLGATERFRPVGLATVMLNQAIAGDLMRSVNPNGIQDVSLYAFRSAAGWSAAIVSSSAIEQTVSISFPTAPAQALPLSLLRLEARELWATNENANEVRIVEEAVKPNGTTISFRLPAYGLAVLLPREKRYEK
ncbi:MAG: hypothetical protein ABI977_14510 [Acidobacteriota bacterium]